MATYSSVLAWRIPGAGEPGGLPDGVAQSRTRLKRLSSSSSRNLRIKISSKAYLSLNYHINILVSMQKHFIILCSLI